MPTICSARCSSTAAFLRTVDDDLTTKSYAAYANGSYRNRADRASVGRPSLHQGNEGLRPHDQHILLAAAGRSTRPSPSHRRKGKWNDTSPMVSLDWQATPSTMVYARVAKGFKSGGFNGRANSVRGSDQI